MGEVDFQCRQSLEQQRGRRRLIITTTEDSIIKQPFTFNFPTMNNKAEYEVVITGLRMVVILKIIGLKVRCDSVLVVCQVNRDYAAKDEQMEAYLLLVLSLKAKFFRCDFKRVPRSENNYADSLANLTSVTKF